MKTKFVKETDRKGTYIIEGSFDGTFFNIKRFICQVQKQETEKETQELADFILSKLNSKLNKNEPRSNNSSPMDA